MKYIQALLFVLISSLCQAQKQDSLATRKNIIKINLMSSALYRNSAAFSYERVTWPNQSVAVMLGIVKFPTIASFGSFIHVQDDTKKNGSVVGLEYRFYFKRENKYKAPHGLHAGPYINNFHFKNDRSIVYTPADGQPPSNAMLYSDINILNVGAQMGYQFIIGNRWAIDVVFIGPSVSHYSLKQRLDGDFEVDEEDILQNEMLTALAKRFPIIKDLLVDQTVNLHGTTQQWSAGFRYQLNVGYHFGRKKKK